MSEQYDFNAHYEKGQTIYYVVVHSAFIKIKKIYELHIRTIYPDMMVGTIENGACVCIGRTDKDRIFDNYVDAKLFYDSLDDFEDEDD